MISEIRVLLAVGVEIYKAVQDVKQHNDAQEIAKIKQNPRGWLADHFGSNGVRGGNGGCIETNDSDIN